jgi:DNA/RNA endonuclease YhcR with UshA esterase domain
MNARVDPRWKAVYLSKESLELVQNSPNWEYPQDLLLVVDYAGESAEELGTLLCAMNERQTRTLLKKIRLLFIERQGASRDATSGTLIWPTWFEHFRKEGERRIALEELLYRFDPERYFLSLPALNENDLRKIAEDYAADPSHNRTRRIGENDWKSIYEHTQEIEHRDYAEKDAVRPLILLLVVDAWMSTATFREWDYNQVLDHIIKRYKRHWNDTLCRGNEQLYESVERLLLYATATGGLSINDKMPALLKPHKTRLVEHLTWSEVHSLVCGLNSSDKYQGRLQPLEPDLIGEYFVLEVIREKLRGTEERAAFIADLWENPGMFLFLIRCSLDFASKETPFQPLFQQGAKALVPQYVQKRQPLVVADLLVTLTAMQQLADAIETVARLEGLAGEYEGNAEIALEYAKGLFNLSYEQDAGAAEGTIARLEGLAGEYEGNAEIALAYAKGLVNLSTTQDACAAEGTTARLAGPACEYEGNAEIALEYAKGLVNLSNKQDAGAAEGTIARLEGLAGEYEGNAEIALEYAKGLVILMNKENTDNNTEKLANKLEKLIKRYRDAPEFRELIALLSELPNN